ncbi:hypothetical protein [Amycolatopsis sp. SB7-3]|uniref:hypothetical protein n=1 Tax=Amycolatopsis sp. SB7-3 TaxID=3373438 RepID=UPI003742632C
MLVHRFGATWEAGTKHRLSPAGNAPSWDGARCSSSPRAVPVEPDHGFPAARGDEHTSHDPDHDGTGGPDDATGAARFQVRSSQWNGPCNENACSMSAVFRNNGGTGSGSATFFVLWPDKFSYLAQCSVVLPRTGENDFTSAGCVASSAQLQNYFRTHRGGTVRLYVKTES